MIPLLLLTVLAIQQAPATPAVGSLSITVLERGTDAALPGTGVWVIMAGDSAEGRTVRTGPNGVVTVEDLPVGRYIVQVTSDTHLSHERVSGSVAWPAARPEMAVDIQAPGVANVTIPANGVQRVVFWLRRGSEITGRLVKGGKPVAGARLELLTAGDHKVLTHPIVSLARQLESDGDGYFSFSALHPGNYLLRAYPGEGAYGRFNTFYYPGDIDVEHAVQIAVGANTRDELLFEMSLVPTVPVAGRVIDVEGSNCREVFVRRLEVGPDGCRELIVRRLDQDTGDAISQMVVPVQRGTFEVPRMGSGVHGLLYTRRASGGDQLLAAAWQVIHVGGGPLKDIELRAQPAGSMTGTIRFDEGPGPARLDGNASVFLRPTGDAVALRWGLARETWQRDDGAFRIEGIVGEHAVDVNEPSGWIVDAVVLADGQDILDRAFAFEPGKHYEGVRVVLSDRVATIRGTVPAGSSRSLGMVVAFPEDEAFRRLSRYMKRGDVDDGGTFTIRDVRPGTNYLVATCSWPCVSGHDAESLDVLAPTATRVYVDRPGTFSVNLKR